MLRWTPPSTVGLIRMNIEVSRLIGSVLLTTGITLGVSGVLLASAAVLERYVQTVFGSIFIDLGVITVSAGLVVMGGTRVLRRVSY